ncbi:adenosylcobinamide-GDP ribazoletransferase [Paenibacillus sp. 1001270B_150601_E10]|uniref:adenosylcobinamide-GDP ribazoletransferase n=1 Tax=Paenibacillus sp. 1001270B_150601_E10 TaxID=2787079 RepID=UPI00189E1FA9|nr:adenosylcobinamide-GDP ribazoletransferase [Paenibacillus sp. 1001270B_150601_E10]
MKAWAQAIVAAIQFLTRIPIPVQVPFTPNILKRSTVFFPVTGLLIGLITWGAGLLFGSLLPPWPAAAFVLVVMIMLTGGLHLDGLMDTADGLLSGRTVERILEIMKDSRVGAMGVIVCFIVLLLQWSMIATLLQYDAWGLFVVLPFLGSRFAMVWAIAKEPHARADSGLGVLFHGIKGMYLVVAFMLLFLFSSLMLLGDVTWLSSYGIVSGLEHWRLRPEYFLIVFLLLSLLLSFALSRGISRKLGGLTGDTYGCIAELSLTLLFMTVVMNLNL